MYKRQYQKLPFGSGDYPDKYLFLEQNMYFEAFLTSVYQQDGVETIHIPHLNRRAVVIVVVHRHYIVQLLTNLWFTKPVPIYTYARTAVPVCRDSQINVVGGKNRQNIFAFWFPSSYCPVLWPLTCMGVWPAPSRKTSLRTWETVVADHRYSKTYILRSMVCTYIMYDPEVYIEFRQGILDPLLVYHKVFWL